MTNFINSIYTPNDTIVDNFKNYKNIEDWFLYHELIKEKFTIDEETKKIYFFEIIKFRTNIKDILMKKIKSNSSLDKLLQITNNILLDNKVHPQVISNENSFELKFIPNQKENYNILLVSIAIEVVKLITSQDLKYLKKCNNHKCSLIFIDTSKNHSRRWCSMEACGNRSKVNSFSKRKKELNI